MKKEAVRGSTHSSVTVMVRPHRESAEVRILGVGERVIGTLIIKTDGLVFRPAKQKKHRDEVVSYRTLRLLSRAGLGS